MGKITEYPYTETITASDSIFVNKAGTLQQITEANLEQIINEPVNESIAEANARITELTSLLDSLTIKAGDSISVRWAGAGYCSSSGANIYFTIPINKIIKATNVTARFTQSNEGIILRCHGNYTHGSSSSVRVIPTNPRAFVKDDGVKCEFVMANGTAAEAQLPIGIDCQVELVFS